MKLLSGINYIFENFKDKISISYSNGDGSISFTFEDIKFASELVKLKLSSSKGGENVGPAYENIAVYTHLNYLYPICIYGILLSGRQFVCMDVTAPFNWNQNLIEQLGVTTIIATEVCFTKLTQYFTKVVYIDTFNILGLNLHILKTGFKSKLLKSSMLYTIQTSGSTGQPKIVCVPENCILPNIDQLREEFQVTEEDVILSASPFTFDPSIVELFLAFTSGATLFMVSNDVKAIPEVYLNTLFPTNKSGIAITIIQMTPSVFCRWSSEDIKRRILSPESKLKILALGGEQCPQPDYFMHCRSTGNKTKIYNLYGTTEVSCWAMMSNEQDGCLGSSLTETIIHVQDSDGNIITEGSGELLIGSQSRICFVVNEMELDTSKPVFRPTGDLVHVSQNKYRYLGRKDNIIKRWGQRVNLDEIGAYALQYREVSTAYCVLDRKERLVLFVNNNDGLREYLRQMLKEASVPDIILTIPSFPLTKHGKIDKKVLENMANNHFDLEKDNKNMCVDEYFKMLWERYTNTSCDTLLGFLDCGGSSISALQVITEMSFKFPGISTDLLNFLLQNNNIESCCHLFNNLNSQDPERYINTRKHLLDNQEKKEKRLKYDENCAICVQCRGQYYGEKMEESSCALSSQLLLEKTWSYDLGKCIDASPTLIYYKQRKLSLVTVGSHSGRLAIFQLHDGTRLWECTLPDRIESSVCPTKDGKYGIVGCYDGNVYSIHLTSGRIIWAVKTEAMVKCTPLLVDNFIIIGSYDHHIYCIDAEKGKVLWTYKTSASVFSSPVYSKRQELILVGNLGGIVLALKPDTGTLSWKLKLSNPIFSTPVTISWKQEDHLIIAEVNGALSCVSVVDNKQIWSFKADGNIFSSLTSQQYSESRVHIIFGCHDHNIYCIEATETTAELIWKTNIGSPIYATPTITTALPYVITASTKGCIFILDIITGKIKCNLDLLGEIFSSPVVFQSKIVVGCRDNVLCCLTINF